MKHNVKTFADAKQDVVNSTTNFGMFKTLKYNRGEDDGIDTTRLNKFKKLFENDEYFKHIIHVFVNLMGYVIDGHHKLALHKWLAEQGIIVPINFVILTEPEFNEKDEVKLMGAIARYNAITSKWDSKAHFNTALKMGLPLAIEIENIQARCRTEYGVDGRFLSANRIYSLLSHDKKRLESNLVSVEDYVNEDLVEVAKTEEFEKELKFVCSVLKELQEWNRVYELTAKIEPFNMIRAAMPKVWGNMLNMEMFLEEIQGMEFNKRFRNVSNTVKACREYTKKLQKKMLDF